MRDPASFPAPAPGRGRRWALVITSLACLGVVIDAAISLWSMPSLPWRVAAIGLPVVLLVAVAGALRTRALSPAGSPSHRRASWVAMVCGGGFVTWLAVVDAYLFATTAGPQVGVVSLLACIPTTAAALWTVRWLGRYHKEPWLAVLVAAGWGALVAVLLVITVEGAWESAAVRALVPGPGLDDSTALSAGLCEELAKGGAVLVLYLGMRDRFHDVVSGIVLGAAVGIGFNLMESVDYMTNIYSIFGPAQGGFGAGFQWYARQVLGMFFGHAAYTAMIGAGFGIARQLPGRRGRLVAIVCGFLGAISAHFAWDAWLALFPISSTSGGATAGGALRILVEVHLRTVALEGPFLALVLLLLVMGIRRRRLALGQHLAAEAAEGTGAVTANEIPVLLTWWPRLRSRLGVGARLGLALYGLLERLQETQYELGLQRWHRDRGEVSAPYTEETRLRRLAVELRRRAGL